MGLLETINPILPKARYSRSIEGCRSCPQFATLVLSEIGHSDLSQIDFVERHRTPTDRRFGFAVHVVYENDQPLIAGSVEVDRSAALSRGFDLDPLEPDFTLLAS